MIDGVCVFSEEPKRVVSRDRLQRQAFSAIPPLQALLSLDCDRPFLTERSGGVATIVCDTTENAVRQGLCYRCLAIGGISVGSPITMLRVPGSVMQLCAPHKQKC